MIYRVFELERDVRAKPTLDNEVCLLNTCVQVYYVQTILPFVVRHKGRGIMKARQCIFFKLSKASHSGIRFWASRISGLKIKPVQGLVLAFLAEEDRISSATLGKRVQLDSATLTGIIDRLETVGVLERERNPDDRRSILICLTEKGRAIAEEIGTIAMESNAEFLSKLSENEQRTLSSLLDKLV